ncbi:transposable element Tcb2 transposase [Trichonephila clavipes]|nr:transposable element Tcb2 transposase [Trichonephila clavipes]
MRRYAGRRNGECLSSIKHVVGTTSGCFYPRSNHWEVGGRPQCDKVWLQSSELLTASFHDFGDNFKLQEQLSGGSVVVVHEEPHPQMTGTLSYRPEETGGRQREKSLDTRHRRLDDRYRVLPWPEDCTVEVCCATPCTVCTFNACPSEKAFSVVPGTPELRDNEWDEYSLQMRADSRRCGSAVPFMDDNAPCHRTVAAEQLLESEDIERMDWPARSPDLNPIEHVWDFLGRRLAARTFTTSNDSEV